MAVFLLAQGDEKRRLDERRRPPAHARPLRPFPGLRGDAEGHRRALCLHQADKELWEILEVQCRLFGVPYAPVPPPDRWLEDGEQLSVGNIQGTVLHTPGHTPGSLCFYFESAKMVLAGDTLFRGGIGRTDLWGGDEQAIEHSIKQRLYALDEATRVITGHGPETKIGYEMRFNPFVPA